MVKRFTFILMLYSALAIMLGHNVVAHHHHDFEHSEIAHHQNDGNHHDNDTEDESEDWGHFLSHFQHGAEGLTFLTSDNATDNLSKKIPPFNAIQVSNFVLQQIIVEVRQNAPPYIAEYYNSQNFLPYGLRAPPVFHRLISLVSSKDSFDLLSHSTSTFSFLFNSKKLNDDKVHSIIGCCSPFVYRMW